ncbi:MAG: hypothetical protein ACJA0J_001583, partial [Bdellovibrionota bacterium]
LANTTALSTFFASPAVKIHQIKKHVLFSSRPLDGGKPRDERYRSVKGLIG